MKSYKTLALVAAFLLSSAGSAYAANIGGDTIDWQYYAYGGAYNNGGSPGSFVVGSTTDTFDGFFTISGNDNQLIFDYSNATHTGAWSPSSMSYDTNGLYIQNGVLLTDLNSTFSTILVDGLTNMSGFSLNNVTWSGNQLAINWMGLNFDTNTKVVLDVNPSVSAVPLPPAALLFAPALLGFIGLRRKSKLAAAA